jgi:hypothetical protein
MSISGMNRTAMAASLARSRSASVGLEDRLAAPAPELLDADATASAAVGSAVVTPDHKPTAAATPIAEELPPSKTLDDLVRYIPTEVITVYLAFLGLATVTNGDYTARWVGLAVFAIGTPSAVFVDWRIKKRQSPDSGKLPAFNLIAATTAFVAWAFALPGTPFEDLGFYDAKWGGFVALVASIALAKAGGLWGPLKPTAS